MNYSTSYNYDTLDNLTTVSQGVQTRSFVYDSLKRLTSAANPESGTVSYLYDDNGNLLAKTDARSIVTNYVYDALSRVTSRSYQNDPSGTPAVSYFYDSQTLPTGAPSFDRGFAVGRLVAATYGGGSAGNYRGYNAVGAVLRQYQQTDSVNYLTEASSTLSGGMATETYPSVPGAGDRRTISFSYDNAARLSSLSSSATSYAPGASVSSISYGPTNSLASQTYGNNLIHAVSYNSRLQPSEIKLGTSGNPTSIVDLAYNYGTTNNNGNLQSVSYSGGGLSYTQSFGYDALNRLTTSNENSGSSWSQTNGYDQYGNRWIDYGGGSHNLAFSISTNRITTSGFSYDSAGNLTNDTIHAYTFDAENKIKTVDSTTAYTYDGEGQRVRKLVGENTRFVYGIGGQLMAEFDGSTGNLKKEHVYGSSLITIEPTAVNSNGTQYSTSDHLGSPRVVTNASAGVVSRHHYMPFGEELGASVGGRTTGMGFSNGGDNNRKKFTSYERDNETMLDFAQARYYSSTQGRFTSADRLTGSMRLVDPQSFNRYAYVSNNPLNFTDPTGLLSSGYDASRSGRNQDDEPGMSQSELAHQQRVQAPRDAVRAIQAAAAGDMGSFLEIVNGNENLEVIPQNSSTDIHEQLHAVSSAGDYGQEDSQRRFGHGVRTPIPKELLPLVNLVRKARKPDFYILTLAAGVQGSVAVTRACTFTVSLGGTTGNVATLMAGWLLQLDKPSDDAVVRFLTGPSFGADIFWNPWTGPDLGGGGGFVRSPENPGTKWSVTLGVGAGGGFSGSNGWAPNWRDLTKRFFP
ncbi:MAG TPA: RHS repeat-associated core domain-containing protein [Pyrinomonadaceae bacterium]|nr:RHS repeat-associated core domain-containing protein [Pyrinomonadaceae bacterium]